MFGDRDIHVPLNLLDHYSLSVPGPRDLQITDIGNMEIYMVYGYMAMKNVKHLKTISYFNILTVFSIPDEALHILGIFSTRFMRELQPGGFS